MQQRGKLLVLWNQTEEDVYEAWRAEGPKPLDWNPERNAPDVGTVLEEMNAMLAALREGGYEVVCVNIEDDLDRLISAIRLHRPDAIFNLVEYFNDDASQESCVAGLYEMMGVSYTGNRPPTLSTCQNKYRTKVMLEAAGLPTAPFFLARSDQVPTDHGLDFPLIVKPALEDASGGIERDSVVTTQEELEARVRHVLKEFEMPALVEEYIDGREIHAAVLGNSPPEVLPLFEMEFDDSEFNPEGEWQPQIISFRAKWDPHSKEFYSMDAVCPAQHLDEEVEDYIRQVSVGAFKALGIRDYCRIDMRLNEEEGEVYILEVNPNPDLVDGTAYIQCATASGRTFSQTLCAIADMAVERGRRAAAPATGAAAALPSDHLLREHILKRRGPPTTKDPRKAAAVAGVPIDDLPGEGEAETEAEGETETETETEGETETETEGESEAESESEGGAEAIDGGPLPPQGGGQGGGATKNRSS